MRWPAASTYCTTLSKERWRPRLSPNNMMTSCSALGTALRAGVEQRGDKLPRFAGRIEGEQAPLLRRLVEGRSTGIREEVGLHAKLAGLAATPHYRTGE